jgi:putative N-acetylmannosamine-6-phosphate epimerase
LSHASVFYTTTLLVTEITRDMLALIQSTVKSPMEIEEEALAAAAVAAGAESQRVEEIELTEEQRYESSTSPA